MKPVVTFGEIMDAWQHLKTFAYDKHVMELTCRAEASVAASICNFGGNARYVTALQSMRVRRQWILFDLLA